MPSKSTASLARSHGPARAARPDRARRTRASSRATAPSPGRAPTKRAAPARPDSRGRSRPASRRVRSTRASPSAGTGRAGDAALAHVAYTGVLADLLADHERVRALLGRLTSDGSPDVKARLFHQVDLELWVHARLEEEIFYPAFGQAMAQSPERALYYEALEEHRSVDRLLEDMRRTDTGSAVFDAQCKVLREQVEHHAGEEEKGMFVAAARTMGSAELAELGQRCLQRRQEILGGGPKDEPRGGRWWNLGRRTPGIAS